MTNCQSCGMPMNAPTDFGAGKTDNPYCRYCTDATGNLLPREVVRQNMVQFYTQTMGKTPEEAIVETDKIMGTMPAWKIQASPVAPVLPVASQGVPVQTLPPPPPTGGSVSEPLVSEPAASPVLAPTEEKPVA